MRGILFSFTALLLLFCAPAARGSEWLESPELESVFAEAHANGTFVLYDVSRDVSTGYNRLRAMTRFIPASTFKIPNTLIGLTYQSVKNVDEILPYGGQPQPVKDWERNMSLREAIKLSNIPIYQELARRTGIENMRAGVKKLGYGNCEIGDVVDTFWLRGPLEISAIEQTRFLARLAQSALPFPAKAQAATREIIKQEEGDGWTLYAKTGTASSLHPVVGWWVGWVEKSGRIYPFALNIDLVKPEDAARRAEIGKACLHALGLL